MDIEHELVVDAPIEQVFAHFSTPQGLDTWWTLTSSADARADGTYGFGFGPEYQWKGVVRVFEPPHAIEWEMTDTSPMPDWLGARVGARLSVEGGGTRVHFYHRGWDGKTAHQRNTSFCWALYLRHMARHCATGALVPYERRLDL